VVRGVRDSRNGEELSGKKAPQNAKQIQTLEERAARVTVFSAVCEM
jgi:hypothetical protein